MKYTKQHPLIRKLATVFLKGYNFIENNDNANIKANGEYVFLKELINSYKNVAPLTVFDVGANVGAYTDTLLSFLQEHPDFSIHLFEPLPECVNELKGKYENKNNIFVEPFGISDKEGTSVLYFESGKSSHSSLYLLNEGASLKHVEINLIPLKKYIQEQGISHIHLLKIDVEGNDYKALLGLGEYLNSDFIDFIQFEYGATLIPSRTFLKDFYELLEPKGFKIAKIMRKSLQFRPWERRLENFTYANYVAVSHKKVPKRFL